MANEAVYDQYFVTDPNNQEIKRLIDIIYPVGTLYWSSKSTNPETLFGGSWTRIKDTVVWAVGDNDVVNDNRFIAEDGGTAMLQTSNLPDHHHAVSISDPGHNHSVSPGGKSGMGGLGIGGYYWSHYNGSTSGSSTTGISAKATGVRNTSDNTYTQTAVNIIPKRLRRYCWERTA